MVASHKFQDFKVVTVVVFILWFQGLTKVPASTAAVFTGIMPISAVLLSYVILQESFAWSHIWGGAFVLAGLGLIVLEPSTRIIKSGNFAGEDCYPPVDTKILINKPGTVKSQNKPTCPR